jgi:peptidoglycan hydrolase CwlO-like protein
MLYSEFIQGTGCKENDHNFKVYKDLEVMYMNSNISKEEVYEYGKKLVDNSKSPEQLALETDLKKQIKEYKEQIQYLKTEVERYQQMLDSETEKDWMKEWKRCIKNCKEDIRLAKLRINELRFVLGC